MKLTKDIQNDFLEFWDFWDALGKYAAENVAWTEDQIKEGETGFNDIGIPNKMMIAAYAAEVWFEAKRAKKGGKRKEAQA